MATQPANRRRWFRFSLRTLLVAMTLLCVWLAIQVNAARRQKEAVEEILKVGGTIGYDYETTPSTSRAVSLARTRLPLNGHEIGFRQKYDVNPNATPTAPAWLRNQIGADYFRRVVSVTFIPKTTDVATAQSGLIDQLAKLPAVKQFCLIGGISRVTSPIETYPNPHEADFTALQYLARLEALTIYNYRVDGPVLSKLCDPARMTHISLCNTNCDDVAMELIGRMTNLEHLWLSNTHLTDVGFAHVEKLTKLQLLFLYEARITDAAVTHLARLNGLKHLWLHHTQITDNGIRELQQALPSTQIFASY